eukprot:TRINITY_DN6670_c0_g1_i1.p1 TRINITY_DN6670_c0_g1~~TRINITY_DN6670_c0_g1_i1.p1  ORF type:complete len:370 (+),score=58.87 TRINITY_DN6670_c0_g1_i1:269-1378(+)
MATVHGSMETKQTATDAHVVIRTGSSVRPRSASSKPSRTVYYVSKLRVQLQPNPADGTLTVTETIHYRHFQSVDRHSRKHTCVSGRMQLKEIQCLEDSNVRVLKQKSEGDTYKVYFGFSPTDQPRTFQMKYVVSDIVARDSVTFEDFLDWIFLDGHWESPIRLFEVELLLPAGVALFEKQIKIGPNGVASFVEDRQSFNQYLFVRENLPEKILVSTKISWIDPRVYRALPATQQQSVIAYLSGREGSDLSNQANKLIRSLRDGSQATSTTRSLSRSSSATLSRPNEGHTPTLHNTGNSSARPNSSRSQNHGGSGSTAAMGESLRRDYRPQSRESSHRPRSRPSSAGSSRSSLASQRGGNGLANRTVTFS